MILYTMIPNELIFPEENHSYKMQKMIYYQGVPLLVELSDDQSFQIVRLMSTNPQHYLDNRFLPGTKISLFNNESLSTF